MIYLFRILYTSILLVISAHALQYTQTPFGHALSSNVQSNMTVTPPRERILLGKPGSELCSGCYDSTSSNLIDPMSTYFAECNTHSDGCWGFFVVRTAYGDGIDDERIAGAMRRLEDAAHNIISCWRRNSKWDNCQEIDNYARSRYHSVLLEDPSLAGATIPQARRFFQDWASPWCPVNEDDPSMRDRSARFSAFILLDEQVLANIETFPARGDLDAFDEVYLHPTTQWFKLIDTDNEDPELGQVAVTAYHVANAFRNLAEEPHALETFRRATELSDEFTGAAFGWERYNG